jgi:hypothetical protein
MLVYTKGLTRDLEGKTVSILFGDGEEQVLKMEFVMIFDCHDSCNGFVYKLISTNRPEKFEKQRQEHPEGFSCLGKFEDVVSWKLVEDSKFK